MLSKRWTSPSSCGERAAGLGRRFHRQRKDFRVGGFRVLAPEAFEPGLNALSAPIRLWSGLGAEDRAEIGIFRHPAGFRGGEIGPADRDRIFWPEAELLARSPIGQKQAAADLLARHVEKDRRRVEDRRLDAHETSRQEMLERAVSRARSGLDGGVV